VKVFCSLSLGEGASRRKGSDSNVVQAMSPKVVGWDSGLICETPN